MHRELVWPLKLCIHRCASIRVLFVFWFVLVVASASGSHALFALGWGGSIGSHLFICGSL
jgi:hypothetical protein